MMWAIGCRSICFPSHRILFRLIHLKNERHWRTLEVQYKTILWSVLFNGEEFKLKWTIIPLEPRGTTGTIWRKSPLNRMHLPPNGTAGICMIARNVLSTASMQYRTHITISSHMIKWAWRIVSANFESIEIEQTLSSVQGIGILKTECAVLPLPKAKQRLRK